MIELGLQRISRLLAETPFPWRAIHVAGTNGKGSVCAYIASMLDVYNASEYRQHTRQSGLSYGRFSSPHLVDRGDCISLSGGRSFDFAAIEKMVMARNEKLEIGATEFEILTATAYETFTRQKVDVAIVEVGMGGRLDATNIIGQPTSDLLQKGMHPKTHEQLSQVSRVTEQRRPLPLVTALTKIGLDHQGFLGDTIEEIAEHKAGIIKHRVPVVFDVSNPDEVLEIFTDVAKAHAAPLVHWEHSISTFTDGVNFNMGLIERAEDYGPGSNPHALPAHIKKNIGVAFYTVCSALRRLERLPWRVSQRLTIQELEKMGSAVRPHPHHTLSLELLKEMLKAPLQTVIHGRLEYVDLSAIFGYTEELALLDGAHNAQSAAVLAFEVQKLRRKCKRSPLSESDNQPYHRTTTTSAQATMRLPHRPVTYLIAASSTKDCTEILKPLLLPGDSVFAVEFGPVEGMPWVTPTPSSAILKAAQPLLAGFEGVLAHVSEYGTNLEEALRQACMHAHAAQAPLVIAGSLYLVGDVHRLLRRRTQQNGGAVSSWSSIDDRLEWLNV